MTTVADVEVMQKGLEAALIEQIAALRSEAGGDPLVFLKGLLDIARDLWRTLSLRYVPREPVDACWKLLVLPTGNFWEDFFGEGSNTRLTPERASRVVCADPRENKRTTPLLSILKEVMEGNLTPTFVN